MVPVLADDVAVAALDLPEFGESHLVPGGRIDLQALASTAMSVANLLGWESPFVIAGHSHGAAVAQVAAGMNPSRVQGLVLVGTLGGAPHAIYRRLALSGMAKLAHLAGLLFVRPDFVPVKKAILSIAMRRIFHPESVPHSWIEQEVELLRRHPGVLHSMVSVTQGDPCAELLRNAPRIRCPVRIIHGGSDALVSAARARLIHETIVSAGGSSVFEEVPNAGHMLHEYQSELVGRRIRQLLSELEQQRLLSTQP